MFRTLAEPRVLWVRGVSSSTMLSVLNVFEKMKGMLCGCAFGLNWILTKECETRLCWLSILPCRENQEMDKKCAGNFEVQYVSL